MLKRISMYRLRDSVRVRKDLDGYIVYNKGRNYFIINPLSYDILSCCDGQHEMEDIVKYISKEYSISLDVVEKDIQEFLKLAEKSGILEE
ncbi:MAG: PqqD family protein [Promethearchaeota archaeon]